MRLPGKKAVQKSTRWIQSRFVNRALILGYHRIADVPQDPYSLCVSPDNFFEQMQVLREYASPLSLGELVNSLKADNLPSRAVALTFDDGYSDILYNAKPILDELNIPFTVFAVSGYLGQEFWWDELGRMVLDASSPTGELMLRVKTQEYKWDLSNKADYAKRHRALLSIFRVLRSLPESLRQEQLEHIRSWAQIDSDRSTFARCLTSEELGSLIQGGLVDIGAHGSSHTDLTVLSPDQYGSEIKKSKDYLEGILGKPIICFSYPNGSFTQRIIKKVREANYHYACTSYNDVVWRGSKLFTLPRFWIPEINGRQFYRWLKRWS
jgi:peptidoglycan/xylan/chitin deacetylase (PgdA/CDA1 family)